VIVYAALSEGVFNFMTSFSVLCLKAFGDLVIANTMLHKIDKSASPPFGQVIGNHLKELTESLAPSWPVVILEHGEGGVPSIFDVRKNGLVHAAASAIRLHKAFRNLALEANACLIVDKSGIRERFATAGLPLVTLPANTPNIYLAYSLALASHGFVMNETSVPKHSHDGPLGVFPGSRIVEKNLSLSLVQKVIETCTQSNAPAQLFLLEGERPDLERSGLEYILVPRQFSAMKRAVESCRAVLSADSMPAHLAEASGVPVFVLSPVPNAFWLPLSSYEQARWCLFSDSGLRNQLSEYLQSLQ
jgi:hypothetical protein